MNRGLWGLGALLTAALVIGCGGKGGDTKSRSTTTGGSLAVLVNGDAGTDVGPSAAVHTLAVYRSDGEKVDERTVSLSRGTKVVDFENLPAGTLRLHVGLRATAGGEEIGAIDRTFQGGVASDPIQVEMRQPVAAVEVSPGSTTVAVGAKTTLYAAGKAADGGYVYTPRDGWNWLSTDAVTATVDASGAVSGVAQGNTSIAATHLASGKRGTGSVGVFSNQVVQGKWTIMVYMDAANDLFPFAVKNLNQIESIANNPNVRFVVQWKQVQGLQGNDSPLFSGTRRYLAQFDATSISDFNNEIKSTVIQELGAGVDMASPSELRSFVDWTKANYPAQHYALVLWSHGGGWYSTRSLTAPLKPRAIIYDDDTNNYLSLPDVRNALDEGSLDILSYDACLMQGAESLLEFASKTRYVVGSEDDVPADGLPYNVVFRPFVDNPDDGVADLARGIVTEYVNKYKGTGAGFPIQMSVLDTSTTASFVTALDNLGKALLDGGATTGLSTAAVRSAAQQIQPGNRAYHYYDLDQLAALMVARPALGTNVQSAAAALRAAIAQTVVANSSDSSATNYKGVSIDFSSSGAINGGGYANGYGKLQLSALTHWNEFLTNTTANL